jgi:hypothetical protein
MRQSEEHSAVLVIRAWAEPGSPIRARLTQTPDADVPGFEQSAAEGEQQILAAVAEWLRAVESER